jgi:hypothetical protein
MRRYYDLSNKLRIRIFTGHVLFWVSYGFRAERQWMLTRNWQGFYYRRAANGTLHGAAAFVTWSHWRQ